MANEGYFSVETKFDKGGVSVNARKSGRFLVTGDNASKTPQSIGTSAETVTFAGITGAPQLLMISNLDSTNFIEIGGDSGLTVFKLKLLAGMTNLISLSSATLYAKADTAAVRIQVVPVEL